MRILRITTAVVLGAVLVVLLAAAWLLATEPGLRWAARKLPPEVSLDGLRGTLASDIRFERLGYERDGMRVLARDGRLRLELLSFLGQRAGIRYLELEELHMALPARPDASRPDLPLGVRIGEAKIARIEVQGVTLTDFRLHDAALLPSGVAANAAFSVPAHRATAEVRISGPLHRIEISAKGMVREIPASGRFLITDLKALEAMELDAGPVDLRKLDAAWPRTALDITVRGTPTAGRVNVANREPGPLDQERIPLVSLESAFTTDFRVLNLSDLTLQAGGTWIGNAQLTPEEAKLEAHATTLDLSALHTRLLRTQLSGPLRVAATREAQSAQGTLAQPGMQVSADIARRGPLVEVRALRAFAGGGELRGQGTLNTEAMSVDAVAQLARFDPARFGDFPHGALSGKISASGTLGAAVDARWDLSGRLHDEALVSRGSARLSKERVAQANASLRFGAKLLAVRGDFGRPADRLQWEFEDRRLRANGTLAGSLQKHVLDAKVRGPELDAQAQLAGSWRAGTWSGEVRSLRNAGRYPLQLKAPARLAVARGKVDLGHAEAELGVGYLRIAQLAWTPQRLASSGEFSRLPAQWLVAAAGLTDVLKSTLLLDGKWSLSSAPRLTGTASLRRAGGDLTVTNGASLALGLEKAAIDARFTDGRVAIEGEVGARFAAAKVKGEIMPAPGAPGIGITADSPVSLQAQVAFVELGTLTRGLVTDARIDGRLAGDLRIAGTLGAPKPGGALTGEALAFDVPPYGVYLKNGVLRARLEGEQVVVEQFSINGGEGRFVAEGRLSLRGGSAKLAWKADRLSLLERPDMRLVATGSGEAALGEGRLSIAGELRADRGFLDLEQDRLPRLGDDVVVAGQPRTRAKARARLPLALDLALDLGERLEVRGHGLEGRLAGRLELQTTRDGELRAYGRVQTVNATFFAYGQRLQVDPGIAVFDGPLDNPSLQMTAWRRNQAVEAGVQVSGTARNPRVQLVSQPPVPEGERLSWLVLGRAPADTTKADLAMLQAAAGALLSRGTETPLDRRIAQAFGLDEITVRGTGEVAQQVVALGKRLSDRLYISFEQGIGAAASALVKLDFTLTQRLSLRAETGTSSGLGLFYRFSWD